MFLYGRIQQKVLPERPRKDAHRRAIIQFMLRQRVYILLLAVPPRKETQVQQNVRKENRPEQANQKGTRRGRQLPVLHLSQGTPHRLLVKTSHIGQTRHQELDVRRLRGPVPQHQGAERAHKVDAQRPPLHHRPQRQGVQLHGLREGVQVQELAQGPHAGAHRRHEVQVLGMRQDMFEQAQTERAHEDTHGREAVHL